MFRLVGTGRSVPATMQIKDDGPNVETCHEGAFCCSRLGRADLGPDVHPARERGADVPGELVLRI